MTLPLILASLIAGALLAFAFAMLEVGDSLILVQRTDYYPITKAILEPLPAARRRALYRQRAWASGPCFC